MALEAALTEKGFASTDAIDAFVEIAEHQMGPHHGARVVARAWVDDAAPLILTPVYTKNFHEFNRLLVSLTGNETLILLTAMLENISDAATASYMRLDHDDDARLAHRALRSQTLLTELIEAGDADAAEDLWRKYLTDARQVLITNQRDTVIDVLTGTD